MKQHSTDLVLDGFDVRSQLFCKVDVLVGGCLRDVQSVDAAEAMILLQRVDEYVVLLENVVPVVVGTCKVLHNERIKCFVLKHSSANFITILAVDGNARVGLLD